MISFIVRIITCITAIFLFQMTVMGIPSLMEPLNQSVYQRDFSGAAEITFRIKNAGLGDLLQAIVIFPESREEKFSVELHGKPEEKSGRLTLPEGGWYLLKLELLHGTKKIYRFKPLKIGVGEVFLTAGQSNFTNYGETRSESKTGKVVIFDGKQWVTAKDPVPTGDGQGGSIWPQLGDRLANEFHVPIGFVCLGLGGSSIKQWLPEYGEVTLYGKTWPPLFSRFEKFIPLLKNTGYRCVLWHQGETDCKSREGTYYSSLKKLITTYRSRFSQDIPWLIGIVGNNWKASDLGLGTRAAQLQICREGTAIKGPDTDQLGSKYRINGTSSHFNQKGLEAHAELWFESIKAVIKDLQNKTK